MNKLYVVMGSYSEYSDRKEWLVASYRDESAAQEHVRRASEALRVFLAIDDDERTEVCRAAGDEDALINPLDTVCGFYSYDYNQRYWLAEVDLLEAVPT